jgi:neutral trehalase
MNHPVAVVVAKKGHCSPCAPLLGSYAKLAQRRARAMERLMWSPEAQAYVDYILPVRSPAQLSYMCGTPSSGVHHLRLSTIR